MTAGDPTPRSPGEILRDNAYKLVESTQLNNQLVRLTVLHRGTETLWQTMYAIYAASIGAGWYQVRSRRVTITEYEKVPT